METQTAIDLCREACKMLLMIGGPLLVAGLAIGLLIGLLQALTQVQEQTIIFVPKLAAMILLLVLAMPWLIAQMVQYSSNLIGGIPGRF